MPPVSRIEEVLRDIINMFMEVNTDLRKVLRPYAKGRLWVALTPDLKKVAGSGRTPLSAIEKAREQGVASPTVLRALPDYSGFIPTS